MGKFVPVISLLAASGFFASGPADAHSQEFSDCMRCHGGPGEPGQDPVPMLPDKFSASWIMYEYPAHYQPPMEYPPEESFKIFGQTYFDAETKSFTEIYQNKCIDIFPDGGRYPCQFLSKGNRTWLIRFDQQNPESIKSCEVWPVPEFYGPQPDFLRNFPTKRSGIFRGHEAQIWLLDIPLPGPFGYMTRPGNDFHPVSFWFPVIGGWAQQDFYSTDRGKIPENVFTLPKQCPD